MSVASVMGCAPSTWSSAICSAKSAGGMESWKLSRFCARRLDVPDVVVVEDRHRQVRSGRHRHGDGLRRADGGSASSGRSVGAPAGHGAPAAGRRRRRRRRAGSRSSAPVADSDRQREQQRQRPRAGALRDVVDGWIRALSCLPRMLASGRRTRCTRTGYVTVRPCDSLSRGAGAAGRVGGGPPDRLDVDELADAEAGELAPVARSP